MSLQDANVWHLKIAIFFFDIINARLVNLYQKTFLNEKN